METSFILCSESNMVADLSLPVSDSGDDVDESETNQARIRMSKRN